jgi:hypothetical protein
MSDRTGLLIRVGADSSAGGYNAPVRPSTGDYVYVPVPEAVKPLEGFKTPAKMACDAVRDFNDRNDTDFETPPGWYHGLHIDPDFSALSYGDAGQKARALKDQLGEGDFVVFYSSMKPVEDEEAPYPGKYVYALIGIMFLETDPIFPSDVSPGNFYKNAHTRRSFQSTEEVVQKWKEGEVEYHPDVLFYADEENSGRFEKCIDIGEWRDNSYRVREDILEEWGGLSVNDGFIQRNLNRVRFQDPGKFLQWLEDENPGVVQNNFSSSSY